MKKLLSVALVITLVSISKLAFADDSNVTIWVSKASDSSAKILTVAPLGYTPSKEVSIIPISFDSGASWDNVKRTYSVSPDIEAAIEKKSVSISVGTDGTATFHLTSPKSKKK